MHEHEHSLNEDIAKIMMPSIQPFDWEHKDKIICRPLLESENSLQEKIPWITVGMDKPEQFEPLQKTPGNEKHFDLFFNAAMKNLGSIEISLTDFNAAGFTIIVASGNYYAAEKILDKVFLKELQEKYNYKNLAVSLPRKGTLFITNGMLTAGEMQKFMAFTGIKFSDNEKTKPISKTVFAVQDGIINGIIPSKVNKQLPEKSFWRKLFGG